MTILEKAYENSKRFLDFKFDDKLYTIRRNLMVVSSIVIGITFLSPPSNGKYEVNIGVLKGAIEKPEYVSYFLAITCIYYLLWFNIHCRKLVVSNYSTIKHHFMSQLAALRAVEKYDEIAKSIEHDLPNPTSFNPEGGGKGEWAATVEFVKPQAMEKYGDGLNELKKEGTFLFHEGKDRIKLTFQYDTVFEDYQYLENYLDHYWRAKASAMFTTVLPITYACISLLILSFHIYKILNGS